MSDARLPVAIIGAGPVGLPPPSSSSAGRNAPRAGSRPDCRAQRPAMGTCPHVHPWRYCVDDEAGALLAAFGWTHPPADAVPTGAELVADYLEPLAGLPALARHIHLNSRVVAVTRARLGQGADGWARRASLRAADRRA